MVESWPTIGPVVVADKMSENVNKFVDKFLASTKFINISRDILPLKTCRIVSFVQTYISNFDNNAELFVIIRVRKFIILISRA